MIIEGVKPICFKQNIEMQSRILVDWSLADCGDVYAKLTLDNAPHDDFSLDRGRQRSNAKCEKRDAEKGIIELN